MRSADSVDCASTGCIDAAVSIAACTSGLSDPCPGAPSPQSAYARVTAATSLAYILGASRATASSRPDLATALSLPHTRALANAPTTSAISSASMLTASRATASTAADTTDHGGDSPAAAYPSMTPAMFFGVIRGASNTAARARASLTALAGATPARRNARSTSPIASGPNDPFEESVSRTTARPRASPASDGMGTHPASAKASSVLTTSSARICGADCATALASASRVVAAGLTRVDAKTARASTASEASANLAIFLSKPELSGAALARW